MDTIKVLTVRQPWAHLIVTGVKSIENRSRTIHHRGPVLILASLNCSRSYYEEAVEKVRRRLGDKIADAIPSRDELPRGGIIGRAEIFGVVSPEPPGIVGWYPDGADHRWHVRDQHGWCLRNAQPVPFTPCSGALYLFDFDERKLRAS